MSESLQDIAFAWRTALKTPATALLIVLTLALGIGANSAMFSVAYQTLLAPLPYEDGERLYILEQRSEAGSGGARWSWPTLNDFRSQSSVLEDIAHYVHLPMPVVGGSEPYQASAGVVSGNFFDLLGITPLHGRGFLPMDDVSGAAPVMLLSHDFWTSRFTADPRVVGSSLEMKDIVYTVIGVLPEMPPYPHRNDVWIPAASDPYLLFSLTDTDVNRESGWASHALGKLAVQATPAEAERDLATLAGRLADTYADSYPEGYGVALHPLDEALIGDSATTFILLLGLAFLVVLIACANVANLNLARLASRAQELSIREAVGADPGRIARQLLTESFLYALAGGLAGLAIAYPCLSLLASFAQGFTPLASGIRMDASMLLFTFAVMAFTGLLSGSASAFQRRDINRTLKEGGSKATSSSSGARRRKALLMTQYALSFVILTSGLLIVLSLSRLQSQETGYETDRVLAASVMLNYDFAAERPAIEDHMRNFARNLLTGAAAIPGVEGAAVMAGTPLLQEVSYLAPGPIEIEGNSFESDGKPIAAFHAVSAGYFSLLDIPLLAGEDFSQAMDAVAPVAVVNENVARRYFPDGDAVGRRIRFSGTEWRTIIGIVGNLRAESLDRMEELAVYYNFWQYPTEAINLYVTSRTSPASLEDVLAASIHAIDAEQSIASIGPLSELKAAWLSPVRVRATLVGIFGVLAVLVTLSGVIGLVSYNIGRRVREIGVHMAVGANPANVMNIFVLEGLETYLYGLLAGLVLMAASAPIIQTFLYETNALDPRIYLTSTAFLTFAVLAAMYAPAKKAGELNPAAALHAE